MNQPRVQCNNIRCIRFRQNGGPRERQVRLVLAESVPGEGEVFERGVQYGRVDVHRQPRSVQDTEQETSENIPETSPGDSSGGAATRQRHWLDKSVGQEEGSEELSQVISMFFSFDRRSKKRKKRERKKEINLGD